MREDVSDDEGEGGVCGDEEEEKTSEHDALPSGSMQTHQNYIMQAPKQRNKFAIADYATNKVNPIVSNYSKNTQKTLCICGTPSHSIDEQCFKCSLSVHSCVKPFKNRRDCFECLSCLTRSMDPLYTIKDVLIETYFKTESIFEYSNLVNFQFLVTQEHLKNSIQIRCINVERMCQSWPMQGAFYLNDESLPLMDVKPLLYNSNKKLRKDEYLTLPLDRLKIGINFLRFKIPRIDQTKFAYKFKSEEKGIYFLSVNSVLQLSKEELVAKTLKNSRVEKRESMKMLRNLYEGLNEISIINDKICLVCPYTRERIKVPVRGRYCKHFLCICLQTLIQTHCGIRAWNCPICDERINEPFVDIWIMTMLSDNTKGVEVVVSPDGNYYWTNQNVEPCNLDSEGELQIIQPPIAHQGKNSSKEEKKSGKQSIAKKLTSLIQKSKEILECIVVSDEKVEVLKSKRQRTQDSVKKITQQGTKKDLKLVREEPILVDIKVLEFKEQKTEQFVKKYGRTRVKMSKKDFPEDFIKMFKEIL